MIAFKTTQVNGKPLPMAFGVFGNRYLAMAKTNEGGKLRISVFIGKILDKTLPLKAGEQAYWIGAGQMDPTRKGHIFYQRVPAEEMARVQKAVDTDSALVDWAFINRALKPETPIKPKMPFDV